MSEAKAGKISTGEQKVDAQLDQSQIRRANEEVTLQLASILTSFPEMRVVLMSPVNAFARTETIDTYDLPLRGESLDETRQWRNGVSRQGVEKIFKVQPLFPDRIVEENIRMFKGEAEHLEVTVATKRALQKTYSDSPKAVKEAKRIVGRFGRQLSLGVASTDPGLTIQRYTPRRGRV
jgi:ABC-type branched-subunit amino acid transport system ATPase component